ncbi:MAG TPA: hypothetical protein VMT20_22315, partial [Terriglobia bacterium]|nr:hypothetical protein [Terriglobia bacterium]
YTPFATWAAVDVWKRRPSRGSVKRVMRAVSTLATGAKLRVADWSAGPVGGPQARTRIGGVSPLSFAYLYIVPVSQG